MINKKEKCIVYEGGKQFFLATVWNSTINPIIVKKETNDSYVLSNGMKIIKRSMTQFIGQTRQEAKQLLINKLKDDMDRQMKALQLRIKKVEEME